MWLTATASLKDAGLETCDPDVLGDVTEITPVAICENKDNDKRATFTYTVDIDPGNVAQEYKYEFSSRTFGIELG